MQWDDTPHAGFTAGIPWLPINPNYVTINAAAAMADPDSVFHHFRRLIALRRELPVLVDGRFELLLAEHEQIWALTRTLEDQVLLMLANCSSAPVTVPDGALPDVSGAEVLLATHPGAEPAWSWRPGSHASTCVADAWPASSDGALVSSSAGFLAARARSRNGRASADPAADHR